MKESMSILRIGCGEVGDGCVMIKCKGARQSCERRSRKDFMSMEVRTIEWGMYI